MTCQLLTDPEYQKHQSRCSGCNICTACNPEHNCLECYEQNKCIDCNKPVEETDLPEFLWNNYGQAADEDLTADAKALKYSIRKAICDASEQDRTCT